MIDKQNISLSPLRITAIYIVVVLLWVVFSNDILRLVISDPHTLDVAKRYKELILAAVVAVGLFYLIKRYRQELKQHTTFIEQIIQKLPVGVAVSTLDEGEQVLMNKKFQEIYGWPEDNLQSHEDFFEHVFPNEVSELRYQNFKDQFYQDTLEKVEWPSVNTVTKDGKQKVINGATIPFEKQNFVISTAIDITKQARLRNKLKSQNKRLERVQKEVKIGYWEFNLNDNNPPVWSDNLYKIFGLDSDEYSPTNESYLKMLHPEDRRAFTKLKQELRNNGKEEDYFRLTKPDGTTRYYRAINELIDYQDEEEKKIVGVIQDISDLRNAELKLQEERKRFKLVAETTSDVIWDMDLESETLWRSGSFEELFGYDYSNETYNFKNWKAHIHPDDYKRIKESFKHFVKEGSGKWKEEYRIQKKDGSVAYVIDRGAIVSKKEGEAVRILGTINEVTERMRAEVQLRESERKYRHFFSNSPEPMFIYDPNTLKFVEVNQAAVDHYGYSEGEFMDMTLGDIRPEEEIEAMKKNVRDNRGTDSHSEKWTHLKKDGTEIKVNMSASDVFFGDHTYRIVLVNDITEGQRMQEKLIQSVIEGENNERKRIAHELHDGLGQYLVAANMNFESVKNEIEDLGHKRKKQFRVGLSLLQNALAETRNIAYNLMPKAIADFGLAAALENMVQDFEKSTDIEFQFEHNCKKMRLNNQAEINIFRIFQELTSNAAKHAQCSKIIMVLQVKDDSLNISIEDNGIGVNLEHMNDGSGLGMKGIKMRVNNLSANIDIESESGEGMKTTIQIPNIQRLTVNGGEHE